MSHATLTVTVTCYNHVQYVGEALEAILSQSFRPLEVIVVDDCSTDGSFEVIQEFARRDPIVHLLRNEQNMGPAFARTRALGLSSGEYLYNASSDDRVLPGLFEKSMSLLTQHPQAGLCCSDPVIFDEHTGVVNENRLHLSDGPTYFSPDDLVELIRWKGVWIAGHTSLVKRSVIEEAGGIIAGSRWVIPELRWHSDWFALLVIGFRYGICYTAEPLAAMRLHPGVYSSGRKEGSAQREVLNHMVRLLKSPTYRDALPLFERSTVLVGFHADIVRAVLSNPEHWDYHSLRLIWRPLWHEVRRRLVPITPSPVKRVYRRIRNRL